MYEEKEITRAHKSGAGGGPLGSQVACGRGHPLGRAGWPPGRWVPHPGLSFGTYISRDLKTPEQKLDREFRRRSEAETTREEKTFPAGRFRRGELLPEGEIVLIVITIIMGIIEIIIISTISVTIPSHLTIAI